VGRQSLRAHSVWGPCFTVPGLSGGRSADLLRLAGFTLEGCVFLLATKSRLASTTSECGLGQFTAPWVPYACPRLRQTSSGSSRMLTTECWAADVLADPFPYGQKINCRRWCPIAAVSGVASCGSQGHSAGTMQREWGEHPWPDSLDNLHAVSVLREGIPLGTCPPLASWRFPLTVQLLPVNKGMSKKLNSQLPQETGRQTGSLASYGPLRQT
jgi:hypothetical protein